MLTTKITNTSLSYYNMLIYISALYSSYWISLTKTEFAFK